MNIKHRLNLRDLNFSEKESSFDEVTEDVQSGDIPEGIINGDQRVMVDAIEKNVENKRIKLRCHLVTFASTQASISWR